MNETEKEFRISNVFYYLLRGRRLIIIFAAIGLIVGVILSGISYLRGEMSKEYKITCSIAINAKNGEGSFASSRTDPNLDDVHLAQELTDSAIYLLKSERTIKAAIEYANLNGVSVKDIQSNLTLTQYNETQIIEMTLDWRSSMEGVRILEAINAVGGETMIDTLKVGNVAVVSAPSSKYIIGGKVNASTWVLCTLFGAAFAVALCILKLFLFPLLTNVDDFRANYSVDVLSAIPYDKRFPEEVPFASDDTKAKKDIISLAHILANTMEHEKCRRLIITSTIRGEGKTVLTANIAQQTAAMGKKTLMVDCDFKNPSLSSMFEGQIPYEKTLNAVYYGKADDSDAVNHITGCLDLLPVILSDDKIIVNDAALSIIDTIAERYDYVFFDCAPVGMDAEVISFKKITDAAMFVAGFDYAELDIIERALTRLKGSGIKLIGCTVNSVKSFKDILSEAQKVSLFFLSSKRRLKKQQNAKPEKAKRRRRKDKKEKKEKKG